MNDRDLAIKWRDFRYDLEKDPLETNNVYRDPAYSEDVRELKRELLALKDMYGDKDDRYLDLMDLRNKIWQD
jgi:hypothetical protein